MNDNRPKLTAEMQVAVLMGGLGTRLGALSRACPKSLADVCGRPFFSYQLELLKASGFHRFLFLVGYRAEQIEEYFGDGSAFGVTIDYCYDGETLLGTGGAVRRALDKLDDEFLLLYGDSFMDIDYDEVLYRFWRGQKNGCRALLTVLENGNRLEKSNVLMKDGILVRYDKKNPSPDMKHVDYGVSVYEKGLFMEANEGAFDLSALQNSLSLAGKLSACEVTNRFYEIGSPSSLYAFADYAKRRFNTQNPAVFLDRDGVINALHFSEDTELIDSPLCPGELALLPGAAEGIRLLKSAGSLVFIVTNQPAAAKGKTSLSRLYDVNTHCIKLLAAAGADIDGAFLCPHFPTAGPYTKEAFLIARCDCRKPSTGLIERATARFCIDRSRSVMVGDSYTDMLAGRSARLSTAFIGKFKCDACQCMGDDKPDAVYPTLLAFAKAWTGRAEKENT